ncbi:alpha/beta fold hydrolase [Marichromatium gracile]|uniref:alpha/beta fold hydrolase n=1 Tax=Marichromatium gracile TaxID=1048 RepID=UPI001F3B5515|nr:alpha/beta fold hydrolase [Marichromatium gracile]MCF1183340.1 alpha/beta fold hydrolase [Marichromatium gracile]
MDSGIDSSIARPEQHSADGGVELPAALEAPAHDLVTEHGGRIHYYVDGPSGTRPLVLVHSVNAAPSAFEMKPLFERYRGERRVYALDLPGFGRSDRGNRRYSPELYANALVDFLDRVVEEEGEIDLVAFSLGCEFAARATALRPQRIGSLVLLSPTGFNARAMPTGVAAERVHRALSIPGLNDGLFRLLTSRPSIKYFYRQAFAGPTPPEMVDYAYATAHQPGAKYAPLYFLSGQLFTPEAGERLYDSLTQPVLVLYDRDPNIDFHELPDFLCRHDNWRAERIAPTRGMPQWDRPAETTAAIDRFWSERSAG